MIDINDKKIQTPDSPDACRKIIKELMSRSNINVSELARRINLPQPTIHRLLTGKTEDPKLSTLSLIANYFLVTIDQLLGHIPLTGNMRNNSKGIHHIPLLSWQEAVNHKQMLLTKVQIEGDNCLLAPPGVSVGSFCLKTKKSMEPRFVAGTLLVIDPNVPPIDGDLVIACYPGATEATVREIVLDGPKKALLSILDSTIYDLLTNDIQITGVIIQAQISYR